jgi:hypothetical protein
MITVVHREGWAGACGLGEHRADLIVIYALYRAYAIRFRGTFLDKDERARSFLTISANHAEYIVRSNSSGVSLAFPSVALWQQSG